VKKLPGVLAAWIVFEAAVTFVPPYLTATYLVFQSPLWLVLPCCVWAAGWTFVFTRMSYRHYLMHWQNDCLVFAEFAKQFRNSDPLLANAMWQKIHPNIPPPWLSREARTGGQE
jgi:hypothetical protein